MTEPPAVVGEADVRVPEFRRDVRVFAWALASGVSTLGDLAWFVGLAWTSTRVAGAHGAALTLGLGSLPRAAVLLFGGALADRLDARRTMVFANLGRICVLLAGIVLMHLYGVRLWMLVGTAVVFGLVDGFYTPASGTMPPQMVRRDDLGRVAALFQLTARLAAFLGAPIGGILVAHGGLSAVMGFDAASFGVIAAALAVAIRPRFPRPPAEFSSVLANLRGGFGYLRRRVEVRTLVMALAGLNLFVSPVTAVGLSLRTNHEGWGATTFGVFTACLSAAAAGGTIIALRWRPQQPARTGLSLLIPQALACAAIGIAGYHGTLVAMIVVGLTAGLASSFLAGAAQATIDSEYLGRATSIMTLADSAFMPLAMAGFGAIAARSVSLACATAGALFVAMLVWSIARLSGTSMPS